MTVTKAKTLNTNQMRSLLVLTALVATFVIALPAPHGSFCGSDFLGDLGNVVAKITILDSNELALDIKGNIGDVDCKSTPYRYNSNTAGIALKDINKEGSCANGIKRNGWTGYFMAYNFTSETMVVYFEKELSVAIIAPHCGNKRQEAEFDAEMKELLDEQRRH